MHFVRYNILILSNVDKLESFICQYAFSCVISYIGHIVILKGMFIIVNEIICYVTFTNVLAECNSKRD